MNWEPLPLEQMLKISNVLNQDSISETDVDSGQIRADHKTDPAFAINPSMRNHDLIHDMKAITSKLSNVSCVH